jgi:hypothetical protein
MARDAAANIRDKIQSGILPLPPTPPEKCFAGKGTSRQCDGCDEAITADEIEYDLTPPTAVRCASTPSA